MSEPMNAEEFIDYLADDFCNCDQCHEGNILAIKRRDAQLITSTLKAAADRVCFDCGVNESGVPCIDECSERKAIIDGIGEKEK